MTYELGITRRCIVEDLGCSEPFPSLDALADDFQIVDAFVKQRSQSPIGPEAIQGFVSKIVPYSLHAGRERGLTWHWESQGIVWLLAARFHTSGKPDDAYPYFRELDAKGRLLPATVDLAALEEARAVDLARELLSVGPRLRREALENAGVPVAITLVGRIDLRAVSDAEDPRLMTVAVTMRVRPGNATLPDHWLEAIAAAIIQGSPPDEIEFVLDFADEPLRRDEVAFRGFA